MISEPHRSAGDGPAMPDWRRLIADAHGCALESVLTADLEAVKKSILDFLAVTLAAARHPVVGPVRRLLAANSGPCAVIGLGCSVGPETAALANGILGHALDFDDANVATTMHTSAPLVPALLALTDLGGASGAAFLRAYIAGFVAVGRIGTVAGQAMYELGWHTTGVLGSLGAALSAAALLGLDPDRMHHCLGIACSGASGLKENFGTMTKAFHAGNAARMGVTAALAAEAGLTSGEHAMDGQQGFLRVFAQRVDLDWGERWPSVSAADCLQLKKYPSCWGTHPALDAVLDWRAGSGESWRDVDRITVEVPPRTALNLRFPRPSTGLEAKFSLHYTLAVALLRGVVRISDFADEAIADRDVAAMGERVDLVARDDFARGQRHTRVTIVLKDGRAFVDERARARGDPPDVLPWAELETKVYDCAAQAGLDRPQVTPLVEMVRSLETLGDARALTGALRSLGRLDT